MVSVSISVTNGCNYIDFNYHDNVENEHFVDFYYDQNGDKVIDPSWRNYSENTNPTILPLSEIYDFDESNSFSDAINISFNTTYSYIFNYSHDSDYYKIDSSSSFRFFTFNCNKSCDVYLYKKFRNNTYRKMMNIQNINQSSKLLLEANYIYFLRIVQRGNYTGFYNFSISDISSSLDSSRIYLENIYYNNDFDGYKIKELSSNNQNSNYVRNGNYSSIFPSSMHSIYPARFISTNPRNSWGYTEAIFGAFDGIFAEDGTFSNDLLDDGRYFGLPTSYPGTSVALLNFNDNESHSAKGTSFFVSENIMFSAAHNIYHCYPQEETETYFFDSYKISPGCDWLLGRNANADDFGEYGLSKSYLPFLYLYYKTSNSENNYRYYDWSILVKGTEITTPSTTYLQDYLGIRQFTESRNNLLLYGYPQFFPVDSSAASSKLNKLVVSMGSAIYSSGFFVTTSIDVSAGVSGGPLVIVDDLNQQIYAIGMLSGRNTENVAFSAFNSFNTSLFEEIL